MIDPTSIAVQVLAELVTTLAKNYSRGAVEKALTGDKRGAFVELVADTIVSGVPISKDQATTIANRVVDVLLSNPQLIAEPQRVTAQLFAKEEDDTLLARGHVRYRRAPFQFFKLSKRTKGQLSAIVLSVIGSGVYDGGKTAVMSMSPGQQTQQQVVELVVTGDRVNLRLSPSMDGEVLTMLASGTHVTMIAEEGEWTQVRFAVQSGGEVVGWVSWQYLQKK